MTAEEPICILYIRWVQIQHFKLFKSPLASWEKYTILYSFANKKGSLFQFSVIISSSLIFSLIQCIVLKLYQSQLFFFPHKAHTVSFCLPLRLLSCAIHGKTPSVLRHFSMVSLSTYTMRSFLLILFFMPIIFQCYQPVFF